MRFREHDFFFLHQSNAFTKLCGRTTLNTGYDIRRRRAKKLRAVVTNLFIIFVSGRKDLQEGRGGLAQGPPTYDVRVLTSGAIATAKSMGPKFQSEEGEVVVVWVIFPPGKI